MSFAHLHNGAGHMVCEPWGIMCSWVLSRLGCIKDSLSQRLKVRGKGVTVAAIGWEHFVTIKEDACKMSSNEGNAWMLIICANDSTVLSRM